MPFPEKPLSRLVQLAKTRKKRRLVIAAAEDATVLSSVAMALAQGIIEPILVGDEEKIRKLLPEANMMFSDVEIVHEVDPVASSARAVHMIHEGEGDILMKGFVSTAVLLKAILDKEKGLKQADTLSHLALFDIPSYHKLLGLSDAAMNIYPTLEEKKDIITNAVKIFHRLGCLHPKVAVLGPVEGVNPKIESTVHAALLTLMQRRNQIQGCIVDGPLALDNAISKKAADHKKIISDVAGDADILIAPDLDAGNILYKSLIFLGGSVSAAIITGVRVPVVLTSRADPEESKFLSIALAAALE